MSPYRWWERTCRPRSPGSSPASSQRTASPRRGLEPLIAADLTVLPTFKRPHMTITTRTLDRIEPLLTALGPSRTTRIMGTRCVEGGVIMAIAVDIKTDLNAEDQTGYVWAFLDDARDPSLITRGALVVAGDDGRQRLPS